MAFFRRVGWCALLVGAAGCGLVLDTEASGGGDAGPFADARAGDGGGDTDAGPPPECDTPSDCEALHGAAPCSGGSWVCVDRLCGLECLDCDTDADLDGYGVGTGCLGPDCDDDNRDIGDTAVESCYPDGPADSEGVGVCAAGTRTCTGGTWTGCTGQVLPTGESCNGLDDDCNGAADDLPPIRCGYGECETTVEACTASGLPTLCPPDGVVGADDDCNGLDDDCDGTLDEDCDTCVWAADVGLAMPEDPTNVATPFGTIQAAIDWAAGGDARPKRVCVASSACSLFQFEEQVTMRNGVSVRGGFATGTGERCPGVNTIISPPDGASVTVTFPPEIVGPGITELADMTVAYGSATTSVRAIAVMGAHRARLSHVHVLSSPGSAPTVTGIDVESGDAVISQSRIDLARASSLSVGIHAHPGSTVTVRGLCDSFDAEGRCISTCTSEKGVVGSSLVAAGSPPARVHGIWLEDAPGSIVDGTLVCETRANETIGVKISGDTSGVVVMRSRIAASRGVASSAGVWLDACSGSAGRIVSNYEIGGDVEPGSGTGEGIHAEAPCAPVIEWNRDIRGVSGPGTGPGIGVHCLGGSECFVLGNNIHASTTGGAGSPQRGIGLLCSDGSCRRIEQNVIEGHSGVEEAVGARFDGSAAVVDGNVIAGGCAGTDSIGVDLIDSPARLTNNVVFAGTCAGLTAMSPVYTGLKVSVATRAGEPDVHSNILDGAGEAGSCASAGLRLGAVGGPAGTYRSNAILAGACDLAAHVAEMDEAGDPRVFSHNALDDTRDVAYLDEAGASTLTSASEIDALDDTDAHETLAAACGYTGYPLDVHLTAGSVCIDAGDEIAAPPRDRDGDPRDATPDIGPDEHAP